MISAYTASEKKKLLFPFRRVNLYLLRGVKFSRELIFANLERPVKTAGEPKFVILGK